MSRIGDLAKIAWRVIVLTLLGAVLLLTAFCAIAPGVSERRERARLAACHFVDPVRVEIAGHVLEFPAGVYNSYLLETGDSLHGEATTPYSEALEAGIARRYGVCLDAPQVAPFAARRINSFDEHAVALTSQVGLPQGTASSFRIAEADFFVREAPPPKSRGTRLKVYRRDAENGWFDVVTEGVSPEGFRLAGWCRPTFDGRWSCMVRVKDTQNALSYTFNSIWINDRVFDGAPLPDEFLDVAQKMRALVSLLAAR